MKVVGLRDAKNALSEMAAHAQGEPVLITKHGRPAVLMTGVEGSDMQAVFDLVAGQKDGAKPKPKSRKRGA